MNSLTLDVLESQARNKSVEMQHYYVGVEHLFLALLGLENGITTTLLEQGGHSAEYVQHLLTRLVGVGEQQGYWSGARVTPRAQRILDHTRRLIDEDLPPEIALLLAILREGENMAVRAMVESGIDVGQLIEALRRWTRPSIAQPPPLTVEGGEGLSADEHLILQTMFRKYTRIRVEHRFGGFSGATVIMVRPMHADLRADWPMVVKFDDRQAIRWEKRRYDTFVRDRLPPLTARIDAEPVFSDRSTLGGLKYSFVRSEAHILPRNLAEYAQVNNMAALCQFLREKIYEGFRETWWGQTRPFQFPAWHELELLLPPALTIEILPNTALPDTGRTLHPLGDWCHTRLLLPNEIVAIEGMTALKIKREAGILSICSGDQADAIAYTGRVDVRGLDLTQNVFLRGERVPKLIGRVLQTRDVILLERLRGLDAPFEITLSSSSLPLPPDAWPGAPAALPNPLHAYSQMLNKPLMGMLSTIHGDLHTGNVLVGPGNEAWLIDFEWSRDGYTLFDWAVMEVSLMLDCALSFVGPDWEGIWEALRMLDAIYHGDSPNPNDPSQSPLAHALSAVAEVRRIVTEIINAENPFRIRDTGMLQMTRQTMWAGYYVTLALCALRAATWRTRPLQGRRWMFMVSAMAMEAVQRRATGVSGQTQGSTDPRLASDPGLNITRE